MRDSIEEPLVRLIGRSDLCHEPVSVVATIQFTYTWSLHRRNLNSAQETKDLSFRGDRKLGTFVGNHQLYEYSLNKKQKEIEIKENKIIDLNNEEITFRV